MINSLMLFAVIGTSFFVILGAIKIAGKIMRFAQEHIFLKEFHRRASILGRSDIGMFVVPYQYCSGFIDLELIKNYIPSSTDIDNLLDIMKVVGSSTLSVKQKELYLLSLSNIRHKFLTINQLDRPLSKIGEF